MRKSKILSMGFVFSTLTKCKPTDLRKLVLISKAIWWAERLDSFLGLVIFSYCYNYLGKSIQEWTK